MTVVSRSGILGKEDQQLVQLWWYEARGYRGDRRVVKGC